MEKKRIYTFGNGHAEGKADMRNLLGGKGANLAEMNLIGVPVPPGFTITTEVCNEYFEKGKDDVVALLKNDVEKSIAGVEELMKSKFGDVENPLLVSVRSGARASMPGMMDTILNLGLNDKVVVGLAKKTGNERFAWDSYRRFIQMYGDVVLGMKPTNKEDIDPFEAIIDEELEPGDILYIPPGFPHEGYALENAMNYSVGFRAPNTRELISGFADYVLQRELGGNYYSDPDVPPRAHPADVLPQEMDKLREMMLELINQPEHFKQWFGEFISQSRHELDIAPPEPPYQPDEIYDALKQGDVLVRLGGLRVLRIGDDVYANGEKIDSPHRPALDALASNIALTAENFGDALEDPSFLAMLAALVNSGYWFFEG